MHQLPSGRHIALTIEPLLEKTKSTSYHEYSALKNTIANLEAFSPDVSVVELRSQGGVSCSINGGKLGHFCCGDIDIKLEDIPCSIEGAEPDQVFCYTGLTIKAIGTDRSRHRQWSDDDIEAFKAWVLEEPAQQWLRKAYTEFAAVFSKTSEPARPVDYLLDDDHPAIFNNGCAQEELPDSVIQLIGELIKRDNVQSVSCPYNNSKVWRLLVAEQTRRAQQTGKSQQEAFTLAGPDGGFGFDPREWGGEVHVPYEGACTADLFIAPKWRRFIPETNSATLSKSYHYLLVQRDLGELHCANRRVIGDGWYLYESTRPYMKVDVLGKGG